MEAETIKTRKLKVKENNNKRRESEVGGLRGWSKLPHNTVSVWLCSPQRFPHVVDTV